jgi:16S rRNA (cytosine1402-N4)-methyltransferase
MSHIPVMLEEVLHHLAPAPGETHLDGTFGGGGYSAAILEHADCTVWAIDRDPAAIARGASLAARHPGRLHLLQGCFGDMLALLTDAGVSTLDGVVLDLGVSSYQIDDPARGFSFRLDGPLDMRMGHHGMTAADLVNTTQEAALADILYTLGEERASRRIAKAIVAERAIAPIETTGRLGSIIRSVLPRDASGNDPATRSFQALRIKVNASSWLAEAVICAPKVCNSSTEVSVRPPIARTPPCAMSTSVPSPPFSVAVMPDATVRLSLPMPPSRLPDAPDRSDSRSLPLPTNN